MVRAEQDTQEEDHYFDWFLSIVRERIVDHPCLRSVDRTEEGIVFEILDVQSTKVERVLVPWRILREIRRPFRLAPRKVLKPDAQA